MAAVSTACRRIDTGAIDTGPIDTGARAAAVELPAEEDLADMEFRGFHDGFFWYRIVTAVFEH